MPEQKTRHVLLCGGVGNGRWVTAASGVYQLDVPVPIPYQATAAEIEADIPTPPYESFRTERYLLGPMPISVGTVATELWVGVPVAMTSSEAHQAVICALFQRDAAQQLLGGCRADA
jgi:hypothetical protein